MRFRSGKFTEEHKAIMQRVVDEELDLDTAISKIGMGGKMVTIEVNRMTLKKNMNNLTKVSEKTKELKRREKVETHKCKGCCWGRFTGTKYKCALPNCSKKLGSFKRRSEANESR